MAYFLNNHDHPYSFMLEYQNPNIVETSTSLPSRNRYFGLLNNYENTVPGMQSLLSSMGNLSLANTHYEYTPSHVSSFGFHNHINIHDTTRAQNSFGDHSIESSSSCPSLLNLRSLRGQRLVLVAMDRYGCHLLQQIMEEATHEDINNIISELKNDLHMLMTHPFGNFVIKKFFQTSNISMSQMQYVLHLIIEDVRMLEHVCMDDNGNRVIQKMLERIQTLDEINLVITAMKPIIVALMRNVNGGYVIQQYVKVSSPSSQKIILDEITKDCIGIAKHKYGCCAIQKCLDNADGEVKSRLVHQIISNAVVLAKDQYGNYVVQFLIKMKVMKMNAMIVSQLRYRYVALSMNKFASNVVEDLFEFSERKDVAVIVDELINSHRFLNVLQDPFGNYVAQKVIKSTTGNMRTHFCNIIFSYYRNLYNHLYGKKVLAFASKFHG